MAGLVIVVSAVLVLSCEQAHTDASKRFTPATDVDVNNNPPVKGPYATGPLLQAYVSACPLKGLKHRYRYSCSTDSHKHKKQ